MEKSSVTGLILRRSVGAKIPNYGFGIISTEFQTKLTNFEDPKPNLNG